MRAPFVAVGFVVLFGGFIVANLLHTQASTQVRTTVARVEADPTLKAALGAPLDVIEFGQPSQLRRYSLRNGYDVLTLRTEVRGSRETAELNLETTNVEEQGWVGTYEVRTLGRPRLVDGRYVTEPTRTLITGTFDPDGSARAPSVAAP